MNSVLHHHSIPIESSNNLSPFTATSKQYRYPIMFVIIFVLCWAFLILTCTCRTTLDLRVLQNQRFHHTWITWTSKSTCAQLLYYNQIKNNTWCYTQLSLHVSSLWLMGTLANSWDNAVLTIHTWPTIEAYTIEAYMWSTIDAYICGLPLMPICGLPLMPICGLPFVAYIMA